MKAILSLISLIILLSTSSVAAVDSASGDFCIVGGGSAGSISAYWLHNHGYTVRVFERQDFLGGSCNTIRFPGGWNDAGQSVYADTKLANSLGFGPWQVDMKQIARDLAGSNAITPTIFSTMAEYLADLQAEYFISTPIVPTPPTQAYNETYARFFQLMNTTYRWMDTMQNPPNPLPPEVTEVSMAEFIALNNLTAIIELFLGQLTGAGWGPLEQITAFDALLQRTCTNLIYGNPNYTLPWFSVYNGCESLYDGILARIGASSVRFNATVSFVNRAPVAGPSAITVYGTQNGVPFVDTCSRLIVAIPPTLDQLQFMALTPQEYLVFQHVSYRNLFAGYFNAQGGDLGLVPDIVIANLNFSNPPYDEPTYPNVLNAYRLFTGPMAVQTGYNLQPATDAQAFALTQSIIQGFTGTVGGSAAFDYVNLVSLYKHEFNPHFDSGYLSGANSPYYLLNQLQGTLHTDYVGALNTTASSTPIWNGVYAYFSRKYCPLGENCYAESH